MQKTTMVTKEAASASRKWFIIDATDLVLGKLSVKVADTLRGKNKPIWTPHIDCGDHVIIINASKVILTGNKAKNEFWHTHSHYMGGLRRRSGKEMIEKYSEELITNAVRRMLPKNKLSRQMITKLHIYSNANHKHEAQMPVELKVN
ncbi:MAG: 50S ribosomal protein L13 [Mycoplasma sp.]